MKEHELKTNYIGDLAVIIALQFIMVLFRIVQPIKWPISISGEVQNFLNEFAYFGIEMVLIVFIVEHCIFGRELSFLKLKEIKNHISMFVMYFIFLVLCIGAQYMESRLSREINFDITSIVLRVLVCFISSAFLREIIYRGFVFKSIRSLTSNILIASIITGILSAMTAIPPILREVTIGEPIAQQFILPVILGIYLSILYYYTEDIWECTMIHGLCLVLLYFRTGVLNIVLMGIFASFLVIRLGVGCYTFRKRRSKVGVEENEEVIEEEAEETQQIDKIEQEIKRPEEKEIVREEAQKEIEEVQEEKEILQQEVQEEKETVQQEVQEEKEIVQQEVQEEKEIVQQEVQEEVQEEKETVQQEVQEEKETVQEEVQEEKETVPKGVQEEKEILQKEVQEGNEIVQEEVVENVDRLEEELSKEDVNTEILDLDTLLKQHKKDMALDEGDIDNTVLLTDISEQYTMGETNFIRQEKKQMVKQEPNYIAHLEAYLGEFENIYKQISPTDPPIDMLFFKGEEYNAIVTNGMRAIKMKVPEELRECDQIELMVFLDKSIDFEDKKVQREKGWIIELLVDLALYPLIMNSYLGWGHIVGNGEELEPYDKQCEYCGALIYPPMAQSSTKFGKYKEKDKNIFIFNVMPLYKDELKFIQGHSSDQFINLMYQSGMSQAITPNRLSIMKSLT